MYVQHYNEAKYARNFTMAFALRTISDKLTSHLRKLIVIWVSIQSTGNAYRGKVTLTVNSKDHLTLIIEPTATPGE